MGAVTPARRVALPRDCEAPSRGIATQAPITHRPSNFRGVSTFGTTLSLPHTHRHNHTRAHAHTHVHTPVGNFVPIPCCLEPGEPHQPSRSAACTSPSTPPPKCFPPTARRVAGRGALRGRRRRRWRMAPHRRAPRQRTSAATSA